MLRSMSIPGALHGIEASFRADTSCVSCALPYLKLSGLALSLLPTLVQQ